MELAKNVGEKLREFPVAYMAEMSVEQVLQVAAVTLTTAGTYHTFCGILLGCANFSRDGIARVRSTPRLDPRVLIFALSLRLICAISAS
mmetsp:Transcript_2239/g.6061  ORF Transcript_2239/g.6061 Transcript_2239/m.6061 type:complete len:89 (-) Transcript_2239:266-532(-)